MIVRKIYHPVNHLIGPKLGYDGEEIKVDRHTIVRQPEKFGFIETPEDDSASDEFTFNLISERAGK